MPDPAVVLVAVLFGPALLIWIACILITGVRSLADRVPRARTRIEPDTLFNLPEE